MATVISEYEQLFAEETEEVEFAETPLKTTSSPEMNEVDDAISPSSAGFELGDEDDEDEEGKQA